MPTFEVEANGKRFQIEAPDQQSAINALGTFMQGQAVAPRYDGTDARNDYLDLPLPGTPMKPYEPYEGSSVPLLDPINAFATKAVESIPIAGPALSNVGNNVDAAFASMVEGKPVTPEERAAINAADQEQYPAPAIAGQVTGTVAPFVLASGPAVGARLLGMSGPLWQRMIYGGISGSLIGGADTKARGGSNTDAVVSALMGAGLGSAFPIVEKGASAVVRALMGRNAPKAAKVLATGLGRDRIDPAAIQQRLADLGPDAVLADLGPNMTRQAAAIASLPGEGQTLVRDALVARELGKNARIQGDVDTILGPAPVPSQVEAGLTANRQALGPEYEALFNGPVSRVDTRPIAEDLESLAINERGGAQKAAQKVRDMLDVTGNPGNLDPNPYTLFKTRQAIDGMMAGEKDTGAIRILTQVRQQIDDMLREAVPGIKQVDAKFQELARQGEGFQNGQQALDSGRTAPRPQDIAQQMTEGAIPSSELFVGPSGVPFRVSQGARAEIDRIIGTTANNLTALKSALKGDGSWNRERLASVFGQNKADALLNVLEREQTYQRTYNAALSNSETAARLAAQKDVSPAQFGERPVGIVDLALRVPQFLANTAAKSRSEQVNQQVARALMSRPNPQLVDQMIVAKALADRRGLVAPAAVPLLTNQGF